MFGSFTRGRVLALLVGATAAGGAFAGGSLATGSNSTPANAAAEGIALQGAYVSVVKSVSPSVVQIEDKIGLGSGIVFDSRGRHRHEQPRRLRRELVHGHDAGTGSATARSSWEHSRPTISP